MKKNLVIAIYSGLNLIITSCYKNGTTRHINPSLITGKVIEFGTALPIAGVDFSYDLCVRPGILGCDDYTSGAGVTNVDGLITIPQESISSTDAFDDYSFSKNGYWRNGKAPLFSGFDYGADIPPINHFSDSFEVRLFPVVNIHVHAKNTAITPADTAFYLECQGQCCPGFMARDGNEIFLRRGIDTTFNYPVFGNVENLLYVLKISSVAVDTVFAHSQFIAKGDNVNLEVLY